MAKYKLPNDETLAAVGAVALRQGQLDNAMRLLVKSLANVSWEEALDATAMQSPSELRRRILKLAKQRLGEGQVLIQLESLIARAREVTDDRNEMIHSFWGTESEKPVVRDKRHQYIKAPSRKKLNDLADEMDIIRSEITEARTRGYLFAALERRSPANPQE